ncbi:MAG: heavy-metal-associated domain-containing protein [Clostridiales bacterium]|nr:heavy-metal-associated domain-containing protein [Clostridiales bacterium]
MEKKMLIEGMMCNHCKSAVEKNLAKVAGVSGCTVDLEAKTATITLESDVADAVLMDVVKNLDFKPVRML